MSAPQPAEEVEKDIKKRPDGEDESSLKRRVCDQVGVVPDDVGGDCVKRKCVVSVGPIELSEQLTDESVILKLKDAWQGNNAISLGAIQLLNEPFQVGRISGVLAESQIIRALVEEMCEEVTWTRRQTDFLELNQSCDLISISSPRLMKFYEFLKTDMLAWMRQLTGLPLTHVSANCSMYNHGDHLLVHDDCIADRKIAFVFYLSPWDAVKTWTEEMGGALELFELTDGEKEPKFPVVAKIPPEDNQMVFFRVCDKSFHQVGEVLTMDYPRLTINGWFHGPGAEFEAQVKASPLIGRLKGSNSREFSLDEWINETYLHENNMANIQGEIEDESQISLREFLIPEFSALIVQELSAAAEQLKWERSYSACEQNYENLVWDSVARGPLADLRDLFESKAFFRLLYQYTNLDFAGEHAKEPKCYVELQRWTNECYTMLVNESKENYVGNLLDVILYLNTVQGDGDSTVGTFVYVNQGEKEDADDDEGDDAASGSQMDLHSENNDVLLSVEPQANSLNIVYCTDGTSRFGKYVSKAVDMQGRFVYILSYKYRLYASISFILLILVLGLPMWWKTTEVYRVQLPYTEIERLTKVDIAAQSTVYLYTKYAGRAKLLQTELQDMYQAHHKLRVQFVTVDSDKVPLHLHTPYELEKALNKLVTLKEGEFLFAEWRNLTDDVLLTSGRIAYINADTSSKKIEQVLRTAVFQEHKLNVIGTRMRTFEDLKETRAIGEAIQPFTDIVVTVVNPSAKEQNVLWDVQAAAESYLQPFLNKMTVLTGFNLKTQWKYQATFGEKLQQVVDDSRLKRHYALPEKTLTHFVTAVEHNIGRGISTNPNLQIVVYVPPCSQAPIMIYSKMDERVSNGTTSSFISTKWGGVIVHNPPGEVCERALSGEEHDERTIVQVDSHEVMTVALHLLRRLLDVDVDVSSSVTGASVEELTRLTPRDWELDAYLRSGLVNLLNSVTITLQSLVQLLNDINYIVINDEVGHAIKVAYAELVTAKQLLAENRLQEALIHAKEAFKHSEMAFFDPSLLALLYFPDEQKYAIYIPLFLPIMIPVIQSIMNILKQFRGEKGDKLKTKAD